MKYYQNDVGTEIEVNVGSDVSTATVYRLRVKKPSGEIVTWDATLGAAGVNGITTLTYITVAGDWNEAGWYKLHSYVEMPAGTWRGDLTKFEVHAEFT